MSESDEEQSNLPEAARKFFDDIPGLQAHALRVCGDLNAKLDEGGGLCVVDSFLPEEVAKGIEGFVDALPEERLDTTMRHYRSE
jgi:hypothetical protein